MIGLRVSETVGSVCALRACTNLNFNALRRCHRRCPLVFFPSVTSVGAAESIRAPPLPLALVRHELGLPRCRYAEFVAARRDCARYYAAIGKVPV